MNVWRIGAVVAAGVTLLLGASSAGKAITRLVEPPQPLTGASELGRSLHGIRVRAESSAQELDLGALGRTIVLVFDPDCGPCNANMANWIDVLAGVRDAGIGALALGLADTSRAMGEYWEPFGGLVPVFLADSASIVEAGFRATPTTALIFDGRVAREFVGILNTREQEDLLAAIEAAVP